MTLEQIARIAGVSAATVSLALNDRPGVSRETRERILAIVKETGYRARPSAALLRGSVQFLKVVRHGHTLNEDHNVFIADYIDGLTHRAKELQLRVEIASVPGSVSLNDLTHSMERQDVAGFIVLGTELTPEDVRGIAAVRKPLVFLDTCHDFLACDFADMNNLDSVHLVVAELLATGHRTIGMVTSPVNTTNFRLRETGWRESLAYAGARFEEEFYYSVDSTFQGAWRDFAALLAAGRRLPEGLFCVNDIVCLGVAKALREAGRRIPADISLIGFDNLPTSAHADPPLTTIRVPKQEIGAAAIQLLKERIREPGRPCSKVKIGGDLVRRQSVRQRAG